MQTHKGLFPLFRENVCDNLRLGGGGGGRGECGWGNLDSGDNSLQIKNQRMYRVIRPSVSKIR